MAKETISHAVYNGRELAGTVEALEHGSFIALDANGKRLGAFATRPAASPEGVPRTLPATLPAARLSA